MKDATTGCESHSFVPSHGFETGGPENEDIGDSRMTFCGGFENCLSWGIESRVCPTGWQFSIERRLGYRVLACQLFFVLVIVPEENDDDAGLTPSRNAENTSMESQDGLP